MKGSELKCAIQCDPVLQCHALGVYAKDTLPVLTSSMIRRGVGLIVNTDCSHKKGRHWVAMYFKGKRAELFDSLAEPIDAVFDSYLKTYVQSYLHIDERIQSVDSNVCGLYCLYYLLCTLKAKWSFHRIVHQFDVRNFLWNDTFVSQYVCQYFKYCTPSCFN